MKLRYSGFILDEAVTPDSRSISVWPNQVRKGDVGVLLIQYRNQIEKQKILDFLEHFEEHSPHMEDPE